MIINTKHKCSSVSIIGKNPDGKFFQSNTFVDSNTDKEYYENLDIICQSLEEQGFVIENIRMIREYVQIKRGE